LGIWIAVAGRGEATRQLPWRQITGLSHLLLLTLDVGQGVRAASHGASRKSTDSVRLVKQEASTVVTPRRTATPLFAELSEDNINAKKGNNLPSTSIFS
jgi:hypothetical protein